MTGTPTVRTSVIWVLFPIVVLLQLSRFCGTTFPVLQLGLPPGAELIAGLASLPLKRRRLAHVATPQRPRGHDEAELDRLIAELDRLIAELDQEIAGSSWGLI